MEKKRGPYKKHVVRGDMESPRTTSWREKRKYNETEEAEETFSDEQLDHDDGMSAQAAFANTVTDVSSDIVMESEGQTFDDSVQLQDDTDDVPYEKYADDEKENLSDECDDDDKETDESQSKETPLYPGARISVLVSMIMIMTFVIRHDLSGEAQKDLLLLIELHCGVQSLCKTSLKTFNGYFKDLSSPIEIHYFCKFCNNYQGKLTEVQCRKCKKSEQSYFMYIPLIGQLQSMFADVSKQDLQYAHRKGKKDPDSIDDVYDGKLYRDVFSNGYLHGTKTDQQEKEVHISLQFNTDGVALFRSSSYSVWPMYLTVNELEPKLRYSGEFRIFAGFWFGDNKPIMSVFLKPLVEELQQLYETGTNLFLKGESYLLRAVLLSVVCDAPARCLVQNFVQFNGYIGCPTCLSRGASVKTGVRGSMMSYPYDVDCSSTGFNQARSHGQSLKQARDAEENGTSQCGVKGFSPLYKLPTFDIIKGVTVDYMHCVLLGVQKMLLHQWTDNSHKDDAFYVGDFMSVINTRLQKLSPPNLISRMPRSLLDLKHWKASEFRSFLLFYSVPCLYGILKPEYFSHYLLLVEGIYILSQNSILPKQLSKARLLLAKFCAEIDFLYSERCQTSNIHALLHLSQKVEDLGPLWSHSCFFMKI